MYPLLIIREELVCLVILIFLYFMSKSYKMGKDSKSFTRLNWFAIVHVVFDIITVITVNNLDTVPAWLNTVCHIIFYITAILFANEIFVYVFRMCYPNRFRKIYYVGHSLMLAYLISVPFIGIRYMECEGTNSSTGPAAYVGYALAFTYFLGALAVIFINYRRLQKSVKYALLPMLLVLVVCDVLQVVIPELLFTGGSITIVTVAFFFSLENPVHVFRKKAMTDALTGVQSRQSYDMDMEIIEEKFKKNPNSRYIFAFCDINNLKAVNGLYGHGEGDNYITHVATEFMREFKHADGIYRMGGDEFFVVFHNVNEEIVKKECMRVKKRCSEINTGKAYNPGVAIGYAVSGPEYRNIRDVVRTADYMMYKNKTDMKGAKAFLGTSMGTQLNLAGLTSSLFDAMCSSNERIYPFLCNMETNVTRISPAWSEYFGLDFEFAADFGVKWAERIHPDDVKEDQFTYAEVMTGKRRYYDCEYRALNSMGEYVRCECNGAIYKGINGEPDVFAGYLINHGIEDRVDAITGMPNYAAVDEKLLEILESGVQAILLKMVVNNAERINMLYRYSGGRDILKEAAMLIQEEVGTAGEVYTDKGLNITVVMTGISRHQVEKMYDNIYGALAHGIEMGDRHVPLNISGSAVEIGVNSFSDRDKIRSELLFALDESRYNRHDKLVFTDEVFEGTSNMDFELLARIHRDASGDADNFFMRYQPMIETDTGKILGAEALLRWKDPDLGEIPPGKFIGFLETDACFYDLGLKIIRRAIIDTAEIRKEIPDFMVEVNITALQMKNENFADQVMSILEYENFPPEALVLELTERSKELNADFLKERVADFRRRGVKIALDDMGTGHATIDLLINLPVDEVKLDKNFVDRLGDSESYRMYAKVLTSESAISGTTVCFEGVETEKQLEIIKEYGESVCQGYYFAKPLLFDELKYFVR